MDRIYTLREFRGLCETPDGERELKAGEAAVMKNFSVTREGNLRKRPGSRTLISLAPAPLMGLWCGKIKGTERILAACGGKLWAVSKSEGGWSKRELGAIDCAERAEFVPFGGKIWILNGSQYLSFDGEKLEEPEGYVPLIMISCPPGGGGEKLEGINILTPRRRIWLSPDGKSGDFILPEKGLAAVHYLKNLKTNELLPASAWSIDRAAGRLHLNEAPAADHNSLELCYSMPSDGRAKVQSMRWAELYNGAQDSRLFLCGDGSNEIIYSGLDYQGRARADYFPEHNFLHIAEANSPVTGLIRHHSSLLCFKSDSCWSVKSGIGDMPESGKSQIFSCTPVHRSIGNSAPGQLAIIDNKPRSLHGRELFSWSGSGIYAASGLPERSAQRISDRIYRSLGQMDFARCQCFDDNLRQEYYIFSPEKCLVQNYARDAWYEYTGLDICALANSGQGLISGGSGGELKLLSPDFKSDDGRPIDCRWESGFMAFGAEAMRKNSSLLWVGIKNEARGELGVAVRTDRKSESAPKIITTGLSTFSDADFRRWSFSVSRGPRMKRLKIRAKKFVFYKLILTSCSDNTSVTVPAAEIRLRSSGMAK